MSQVENREVIYVLCEKPFELEPSIEISYHKTKKGAYKEMLRLHKEIGDEFKEWQDFGGYYYVREEQINE